MDNLLIFVTRMNAHQSDNAVGSSVDGKEAMRTGFVPIEGKTDRMLGKQCNKSQSIEANHYSGYSRDIEPQKKFQRRNWIVL